MKLVRLAVCALAILGVADVAHATKRGARTGAVAGAVGGFMVAGPVGAVAGGVGGAVAGHKLTSKSKSHRAVKHTSKAKAR